MTRTNDHQMITKNRFKFFLRKRIFWIVFFGSSQYDISRYGSLENLQGSPSGQQRGFRLGREAPRLPHSLTQECKHVKFSIKSRAALDGRKLRSPMMSTLFTVQHCHVNTALHLL